MSILSLTESSEGTTTTTPSNDCRLETLIVDNDEELHLPDARILLESCNFDATICDNAKESVELVGVNSDRPNNFDVAIVEISMLGTDGFEKLKWTLSERNIPLVVTSTNLDKEFINKHRNESGALDFIQKPHTEEKLKELYRFICQLSNSRMMNMDSEAAAIDAAEQEEQPPRKKPRVVWTPEMHAKFASAVEKLGDKAVPKKILEEMQKTKQKGEPDLTRENIASHLQKHRLSIREKVERQTQHISPLHDHNPNSSYHQLFTQQLRIATNSNHYHTHNNRNTPQPIMRSPTPIQRFDPPPLSHRSQAQQPPMMMNSWEEGMIRALYGSANNNLDAGGNFERMRRLTETTQNPPVIVPHMCPRCSSVFNVQQQAPHDFILDSTGNRSQRTPMDYHPGNSDYTTTIPRGGFSPSDADYNQFWFNNFMWQPPGGYYYHSNNLNEFHCSTSTAMDQQQMMFPSDDPIILFPHQSSLCYNSNPEMMMGTRSVNVSYIMPNHTPTESFQHNYLVNPQPPVAHQTYTDDYLRSAPNNPSILQPPRDHTNEESIEAIQQEQPSNQS